MNKDTGNAARGRQAALVIAGTAVFWVLSTGIGSMVGLSHRILALFDMIALIGFVCALWIIFQIWRARQNSRG